MKSSIKLFENQIEVHNIYRNINFTDYGLSNFGTSLRNCTALNLLALNFHSYIKILKKYSSQNKKV